MKSIFFTLFSLAVLAAAAPAQTLGAETKTFTGKIDESIWVRGGRPLFTFAKITVTADSGEKLVCFVMSSTKQTAVDGTDIGTVRPREGKRVEITYVKIEGGSGPLENADAATALKYLE